MMAKQKLLPFDSIIAVLGKETLFHSELFHTTKCICISEYESAKSMQFSMQGKQN